MKKVKAVDIANYIVKKQGSMSAMKLQKSEAVDFAKEFLTAESVLHEMAVHLYTLLEFGLIQKKV